MLNTYKLSPAERDLLWIMTSPNILVSQHSSFSSVATPSTAEIEAVMNAASDSKLTKHLAQRKSHFLGPYFEQLWLFYLKNSPRYQLLSSNLQVQHQGKTLGEFDIIAYDHYTQRHVHQELAVKFYLSYTQQETGITRWIGPQSIDRLDLKLEKLIHHQLVLGQLEPSQLPLSQLGISQLEPQLLMKGYLFSPLQSRESQAPCLLPNYVNPQHSHHHWLKHRRFIQMLHSEKSNQRWKVLSKQQWLSRFEVTCDQTDTAGVVSSEALASQLLQHHAGDNRAILVARLEPHSCHLQSHKNLLRASDLLFVVPDCWPHCRKSTPSL